MTAEKILRNLNLSIPYDALCLAIPMGRDNAITKKELIARLKYFDVSDLDMCLETCKRYGSPIAKIGSKYYRIQTTKEYEDNLKRNTLMNKLGVKNNIEYR